MARTTKAPTLKELHLQLASSLRRTALRPSIRAYTPQDHQIAFHSSQKKIRLFIGGNRSGKTVGGGAEAVMWLTGEHPYFQKFRPPVRGRAIAVDFDNGVNKITMPEIARWIPPSFLKNGSWEESYTRGDRMLTLTNGSTLEFMSYDQDVDKFSGTSRHFVWFDEEPPEEIYNENMARLIDTGGHAWLTMTPLIDMSWTDERLYQKGKAGTDPNIAVFEVSTSQNSYISIAEMEILTDGMDDAEKEARLHGTYISQSGTIYRNLLTDKTFLDSILDSDLWSIYHQKWGHFGMLDHGYRNPTAFYLGAFDEEGRIVIYEEYYHSNRLVEENALAIKSLIAKHKLTDKVQYIVADPSIKNTDPITGTSIQAAYAEYGLYLSLANNDVKSGINRVSNRFKKEMLYITRNCEKLIWEINKYRWDKFASSKIGSRSNLKETPLKKDDHGCDALRYGIVSRPSLPGEVDMKVGNILNLPTVVGEERIDDELLVMLGIKHQEGRQVFDYTMGSEW